MWSLIGIPVLVGGLLWKRDPILVVAVAAFATGLGGGLDPLAVLSALGKAFNDARYVSIAFLVLPVVGLAERAGLQARSRELVGRLKALTVGRLLIAYLAVRQLSAAVGMLSLGGQASMVRPLIAPMAESVLARQVGGDDPVRRQEVRAQAAAADTVGAFFGEDIFVALGAVLLVQGVLEANGLHTRPATIALWAAPTGLAAFIIHAVRLLRLDARLGRAGQVAGGDAE
jgi:uncharacterized membrane protein